MQQESVNENNARALSEEYIRTIPVYPGHFEGRGIVICAGGPRYFPSAWICINVLRQVGCILPIQLWHLGPSEIDEHMKELVRPLGVECVDAFEVRKIFPARILNGWEVKPYAVIHCPYREVLLLDADNMPAVNPDFLFDTLQYEEHGALFWPDLGRLAPQRMIWDLCGVAYQDEPEIESGQAVIDKQRCWEALALTMYYNEHSDFYYRHIHGDKETFHMAFRKLEKSYAIPQRGTDRTRNLLFQHDFNGDPLFQHQYKWKLSDANQPVQGLLFAEQCHSYIQQLRNLWNGRIGLPNRSGQEQKSVAERQAEEHLTGTEFLYHRVGFDSRPMTFLPNYFIGHGADQCEVLWSVYEHRGDVVLQIRSDTALTCELRRNLDGIWKGSWKVFERMEVELLPCSPLAPTEEATGTG